MNLYSSSSNGESSYSSRTTTATTTTTSLAGQKRELPSSSCSSSDSSNNSGSSSSMSQAVVTPEPKRRQQQHQLQQHEQHEQLPIQQQRGEDDQQQQVSPSNDVGLVTTMSSEMTQVAGNVVVVVEQQDEQEHQRHEHQQTFKSDCIQDVMTKNHRLYHHVSAAKTATAVAVAAPALPNAQKRQDENCADTTPTATSKSLTTVVVLPTSELKEVEEDEVGEQNRLLLQLEKELDGQQQQEEGKEEEEDQQTQLISKSQQWIPVYRRCAGCTITEEIAEVWCCECTRCLCTNCDERIHGVDALDPLSRPMCSHRVEYIVSGGGVPILSPILEIGILVFGLYCIKPLWTNVGNLLHVDYFFESTCPLVYRIRRVVFRIDHALYPLLKGNLSNWCDIEDSFIKIFTDLWIRSILTHTDSFALLLMKTPTTLGALIVVLAIVPPLLALPYAILATCIRMIEIIIFPNWFIVRLLARIVRIVTTIIWLPIRIIGWCCRSTMLGLFMDQDFREYFHRRTKIPPKTGHRKRPTPSHNLLDVSFVGCPTRVTRVFYYFHTKARRAIIGTILSVVFLAIFTRIVLLAMPRCGKGLLSSYAEQEMWSMIIIASGDNIENEPKPKCVSVDILARKLSERFGVTIPQFESLGDEGLVLTKMQDATENDYIDDVIRKFSHAIVKQFLKLEFWIQLVAASVLLIIAFAGLFRRLAFWADLRRRYKYRVLKKIKKIGTLERLRSFREHTKVSEKKEDGEESAD